MTKSVILHSSEYFHLKQNGWYQVSYGQGNLVLMQKRRHKWTLAKTLIVLNVLLLLACLFKGC